MKIVVIGGTGLIGSKLVTNLTQHGHQAIAASPRTGVNTVTGEGLAAVLKGAKVVVDVTNPPSFEQKVLIDFFTTSTSNLLDYGGKAGISHLVALSVVGTQRLGESPYFRAKIIQENLISAGTVPYSIVQATQFFDFMKGLADFSAQGNKVPISPVSFQPMTPDDVAKAVERIALGSPANGTVQIAGPEKLRLDEVIRRVLQAAGDPREVIADPAALYFGAHVTADSLLPEPGATLSETTFEQWLAASQPKEVAAVSG
jgi:uncharacterized protein YbjT (DUF2867 family)